VKRSKPVAKRSKSLSAAGNPFRVGDRVKFRFGIDDVEGVVVEDRGILGAGGRRLYRITVTIEPSEPFFIEMPADQLTAA
jgi:hypothetical protein